MLFVVIPSSIHFVQISFHFSVRLTFHHVYVPFFLTHSSTEGHVVHFLACMNRAATNMHVQVSLWYVNLVLQEHAQDWYS